MAPLVNFPQRRFAVWKYTISHGQLILRSVKDKNFSTRVDVLFKPVSWMSLPAGFNGLVVEIASPEQAGVICASSGFLLHPSDKLFILRGENSKGHVAASVYALDESTREFDEPDKWGNPAFWPATLAERSPDEWRQLGQNNGKRLRSAPPETNDVFLHYMIQQYLLNITYLLEEEQVNAFIEGMKAGYAQPQEGEEAQ